MDLTSALDGPTARRPASSPTSATATSLLPTPCAGWDVRALLNHLLGATWMFTMVNQGQAAERGRGRRHRRRPAPGCDHRSEGERRQLGPAGRF